MAFECFESESCETFHKGIPESLLSGNGRFKSLDQKEARELRERAQKRQRDLQDDEASDESLDHYYLWSRLVEHYARTKISFDKDKLIAIFGLGLIMS